MAPHRVLHHPAVASYFPGILGRIADAPAIGFALAGLSPVLAAIGADPFTWAWLLMIVLSGLDQASGVATAKGIPGAYSAERRARGRREKVITAVMMLGSRGMEAWATSYGLLNVGALLNWIGWEAAARAPAVEQGGIVTAVITFIIAAEELRSIYGHRLRNGGSRVLVLELAFFGFTAVQRLALGKAVKATAAWAGTEESTAFEGNLQALRQMDEAGYALTHGDEPAPGRRHYDAAVEEVQEVATTPRLDAP